MNIFPIYVCMLVCLKLHFSLYRDMTFSHSSLFFHSLLWLHKSPLPLFKSMNFRIFFPSFFIPLFWFNLLALWGFCEFLLLDSNFKSVYKNWIFKSNLELRFSLMTSLLKLEMKSWILSNILMNIFMSHGKDTKY